jgi:hypothetical protein
MKIDGLCSVRLLLDGDICRDIAGWESNMASAIDRYMVSYKIINVN